MIKHVQRPRFLPTPPTPKFQLILRAMSPGSTRYGYSVSRVLVAKPPVDLAKLIDQIVKLVERELA